MMTRRMSSLSAWKTGDPSIVLGLVLQGAPHPSYGTQVRLGVMGDEVEDSNILCQGEWHAVKRGGRAARSKDVEPSMRGRKDLRILVQVVRTEKLH